MPPALLPVDPHIPSILAAVRSRRAAVVVAAPGAGKTTRIPPALSADGPVILLQPRRVAARTIARRIAHEQGWRLGREVGWHVRFDRNFMDETRLLVATEGILTARLQQDPLLSGFRTIVLDEFHERSIHADLGIALAKQAWRARDDLRIVVMSATIDAQGPATYLEGCPVFELPGTLHPVEVEYRPGLSVEDATHDALSRTNGQVLCFLPGAAEVRRAAAVIRSRVSEAVEVFELHGSLTAEEQDRAIAPSPARRVIVATNIAETSLTVPGVGAVVDSGLHKVARYDAERGVDSLELSRVSRDAADQRAGRAGRLGAGLVLRLWNQADHLEPHRVPDVVRIDLAGPVLDLLAWGGDPRTFDWFASPSAGSLEAALQLLSALGAVENGGLTAIGRRMAGLPAHPRLARILIEAGGSYEAAVACAMLSDRQVLPHHPATTTCDLLAGVDGDLPPHIARNARELQRLAGVRKPRDVFSERDLRRALLAGYPDRVGQRRAAGDPRVLLTTGHGALIGPESGVRDGEFILALDVQAAKRGQQSEARIRVAGIVEREWLVPTGTIEVNQVDEVTGVFRTIEREMYGAIVLKECPSRVDPAVAGVHLARTLLGRPLADQDARLVRRLRFAGIDVDLEALAQRAAAGTRTLDDLRLEGGLEWGMREKLEELAPSRFTAPSGRTHTLDYREDGTVALSVKLQELFGLAATPRFGPRRQPLLMVLLAPNGRAVQTTTDLKSFWNSTYPEVRKELRGRYPRHPWPENPWEAAPTARTARRRS